jgi:nucleotidyltransferase substrate binding protein (TIGR01987 family)
MLMDDSRWKQRFSNFDRALGRLREAIAASAAEPENYLYEMASIQAFEFTIEQGWKVLKDYLKFQGVQEISLPRDVIRQAFQARLITDGQTWIDICWKRETKPPTPTMTSR